MDAKIQVLEAMKKEIVLLNAGRITEITKPDRKVVDKIMDELKSDERIFSPKSCYWQAK